jgi:hypothetical protein
MPPRGLGWTPPTNFALPAPVSPQRATRRHHMHQRWPKCSAASCEALRWPPTPLAPRRTCYRSSSVPERRAALKVVKRGPVGAVGGARALRSTEWVGGHRPVRSRPPLCSPRPPEDSLCRVRARASSIASGGGGPACSERRAAWARTAAADASVRDAYDAARSCGEALLEGVSDAQSTARRRRASGAARTRERGVRGEPRRDGDPGSAARLDGTPRLRDSRLRPAGLCAGLDASVLWAWVVDCATTNVGVGAGACTGAVARRRPSEEARARDPARERDGDASCCHAR